MNNILNSSQIIELIAQAGGCDREECEFFYKTLTSLMADTVVSGDVVRVEGLGLFRAKGTQVYFIPERSMIERLNQMVGAFEPIELTDDMTPEMLGLSDQSDKSGKSDQSDQSDKSDQSDESDQSDQSDQSYKSDQSDSSDSSDSSQVLSFFDYEMLQEAASSVIDTYIGEASSNTEPEIQDDPFKFALRMGEIEEEDDLEDVTEPIFLQNRKQQASQPASSTNEAPPTIDTLAPKPWEEQPVAETPAPKPWEEQPVAETPAPKPWEEQPVVETPAPKPWEQTVAETSAPKLWEQTVAETPTPKPWEQQTVAETPTPKPWEQQTVAEPMPYHPTANEDVPYSPSDSADNVAAAEDLRRHREFGGYSTRDKWSKKSSNKRNLIIYICLTILVLVVAGVALFFDQIMSLFHTGKSEDNNPSVVKEAENDKKDDTPVPSIDGTEGNDTETTSQQSTNSDGAVNSEESAQIAQAKNNAEYVYDVISASRTLSVMAKEYYGHKDFWVYIYLDNTDKISNPNYIAGGTRLRIPPRERYDVSDNPQENLAAARAIGRELLAKFPN